jgi:universal stress protein E
LFGASSLCGKDPDMARYEKILVGVDLHQGDRVASKELGPEARAAIEQALLLAIHSGGSVTFCSALNVSPQTATLIAQDHQNLVKTVEDVAAEMLDGVVAQARERGVTADKVVRLGMPGDELAKLAVEGAYDLLVVGTRSRSKASRLLFGSTAQKLVRTAPCAVWIVKPEEVREIREIAVAVDLSDAGRPALAAAVDAARALSAKLFIVHAVDMAELSYLLIAGVSTNEIAEARTRKVDDAKAALQQQLAATDYRTLPHGVMVEVIEGSPDDVIPKFVADQEIDILVLGTHGRSGLSRLVLGNTAERILPMVHCSVIAVKPHDFVSPHAS